MEALEAVDDVGHEGRLHERLASGERHAAVIEAQHIGLAHQQGRQVAGLPAATHQSLAGR